MNDGIDADDGEPAEITRFLEASYGVKVQNMNGVGETDYAWDGLEGRTHLEREVIDHLLNGTEEIEEKLRVKFQAFPNDRIIFMPEGVLEPAPQGVLTYHRQSGRNVMLGQLEPRPPKPARPGLYKMVYGFLYRVGRYCEIHWTTSMAASAVAIGEFYSSDQKESTTFQRYLKHPDWRPNLQVARLLGMTLNDTNMGPDKCEKVILKFGTVWNAMRADPQEWAVIPGISAETARVFMRKNGRFDV